MLNNFKKIFILFLLTFLFCNKAYIYAESTPPTIIDQIAKDSSFEISSLYEEDIKIGDEIIIEPYNENTITINRSLNHYPFPYTTPWNNSINTYGSQLMYEQTLSTYSCDVFDEVQSILYDNQNISDFIPINFNIENIPNTDYNFNLLLKASRSAIGAFINDYLEVFWFDTFSFCAVYTDDNLEITGFVINLIGSTSYGSTTTEVQNSIDALNTKLLYYDSIMESAETNGVFRFDSEYLKAEYLMNTLANHIVYDYEYNTINENPRNGSAYGALVDNDAICQGYARAFQLLCQRYDITCIYAGGVAYPNTIKQTGHAWNYLKLDGQWYFFDPTWFDSNTRNPIYLGAPIPSTHQPDSSTIYGSEQNSVQSFGMPSISSNNYFCIGDSNLDHELTADDATLVLSYVLNGNILFTTQQKINSDYDKNGVINSTDSSLILQDALDTNSTLEEIITEGILVSNENMEKFDLNSDNIINSYDIISNINKISRTRINTVDLQNLL